MEITEWWHKLDSDAQAWLVAHNGEAVAPEVLSKIVTAGGTVNSRGWWIGASGHDGFHLSDKAVDWIEMRANDETD
ncbi:MAG: hypothetical protein ABWY12_07315 [Burkholderiales bacterium]